MSARISSISFLFLLLLLFAGVYFVQKKVDHISVKTSKAESLSLLPNGELLKTVSLGYSSVIADLLWLNVVQAIGDKEVTDSEYQWIYHAVDVVTTLDPKFEYSYQIAGIALTTLGKQYELSNQILLKGIKNRPDDWNLPFYLGFNYYFYLSDYQNAAVYFSRAASLPGHPAYLPGLAARLYVQAKDPELAIEFLKKIYQDAKDETVKERIELRIREATVERDILSLNKKLATYAQLNRRQISDLSDLVRSGMINKIPDEPFGGYYFYDGKIASAQSSTHPNRMKVYKSHS